MLKIKRSFIASVAAVAVMLSAISLNVFAISSASKGSASNLTFNGQGYTVAMMNCNVAVTAGSIGISNFGSGSGNIELGAYCGSTYSYYKTFYGTKTYTFVPSSDVSGSWGVDGKNTSLTKTRTGVTVDWDLT